MVRGILFISAINEYDQEYREDNQIYKSLNFCISLFVDAISNPFLMGKSIILLLNKIDLFKEKLKISPLKNHFPDYNGMKWKGFLVF